PLDRALTSPRPELAGRSLPEVLVARGADEIRIADALATARERGLPLDRAIVELGVVTSDQLARALADRHGLLHLDL
ncbi:hypothetical protein OFO99_41045, partial [Escherichia coli]|nr:hypothetical protein [Escherichia coli]